MYNVHYKYPRPDFNRVLRPQDLATLGIETKEILVWSTENNFQLTLNNKLSESLVAKLPDDFYLSNRQDDEPAPIVDDLDAGSPEEIVNDSQSDENDDDESLTVDIDPDE